MNKIIYAGDEEPTVPHQWQDTGNADGIRGRKVRRYHCIRCGYSLQCMADRADAFLEGIGLPTDCDAMMVRLIQNS